jgi:hypothetical protein
MDQLPRQFEVAVVTLSMTFGLRGGFIGMQWSRVRRMILYDV